MFHCSGIITVGRGGGCPYILCVDPYFQAIYRPIYIRYCKFPHPPPCRSQNLPAHPFHWFCLFLILHTFITFVRFIRRLRLRCPSRNGHPATEVFCCQWILKEADLMNFEIRKWHLIFPLYEQHSMHTQGPKSWQHMWLLHSENTM